MSQPDRFVICIDDRKSGGALRRGEVYRVVAVYDRFVAVEDGRLNGWYQHRFAPAPDISSLLALLSEPTPHESRVNC